MNQFRLTVVYFKSKKNSRRRHEDESIGSVGGDVVSGRNIEFCGRFHYGNLEVERVKVENRRRSYKKSTVTYAQDGDNTKVTIDGTGADGKPTHSEWTGKFDGNDYPVTGDTLSDTRSMKQINDHTFAIVGKKDGKPVLTGKVVVAADGKTRTVTTTTTDSSGKKITSTAVYEKQ